MLADQNLGFTIATPVGLLLASVLAVASTVEGGASTTTGFLPRIDGPVTQTTVTNALGHASVSTVDPAWGLSTAMVDPNLKRTDLDYDALGRLASVWAPGSVKGTDKANATFAYYVGQDAVFLDAFCRATPWLWRRAPTERG